MSRPERDSSQRDPLEDFDARQRTILGSHLVDREGEPTRAALDEILGFFCTRLASPPAPT